MTGPRKIDVESSLVAVLLLTSRLIEYPMVNAARNRTRSQI